MKVLIAAGTRPEAIKLAPIVTTLRSRPDTSVLFCGTGQHREMFDQVLSLFGLALDLDLQLMRPDQTLHELTSRVLLRMTDVMQSFSPDWVVVQGDTTSAMATALAAYYLKLPVAHVEAGLRTHNRFHPFPEELNRKIADAVAEVLFAPTERAAGNLRAEGYAHDQIVVTGNTGIDSLLHVASQPPTPWVSSVLSGVGHSRIVLVTTHRRENFGPALIDICQALLTIASRFPAVRFVVPVHRNPHVRDTLHRLLSAHTSFSLTEPLEYHDFVALMQASFLILTDSGGVQEEAPTFGRPVLVLRERTERQESVDAGTARLVGTNPQAIVDETSRLLTDVDAYRAMVAVRNPYGDGRASARVVDALVQRTAVGTPLGAAS